MPHREDPVLRHARREAIIISLVWLAATVYCCTYAYLFGYIRPDRPLGPEDVRPVLGMPSWFFWGVMVPWIICGLFTFWFAGFYMADDDLGRDHSAELEADIREGGLHE
ncbi:MAG: hypothetical protein IRY99_23765 [Isosphaeraceae bacterium]|nr:hypothetical protein [Isosphaeraceae bacterium]